MIVTNMSPSDTGSSMMYGNNATAGTSYLPSFGKKVWVDADVMLARGTLEKYFVYVHNVTTGLLPYLRLQIWTPVHSDMETRYRLKWQKEVAITEVDRLYEVRFGQKKTRRHTIIGLTVSNIVSKAGDFFGKTNCSVRKLRGHKNHVVVQKCCSLPKNIPRDLNYS